LNAAPAAAWPAILAAPDSATRSEAAAALTLACPTRGADTTDVLWRSALHAMHTQAASAHPRFVTVSGDLLAHMFDCKYKTLLPRATHAEYVAFTEKTIRYIVSSLRSALPATPIYLALGNNDSSCTDYQLAPAHDELLALTARLAAEVLPAADRAGVLATFPLTGSYSAPLAGVPHTRILVLDDLFLAAQYKTCAGERDPSPAAAQLAWLTEQLASARDHRQRVWVVGHIPPGINLYSTARKLTDVCGGGKPVTFLASDQLARTLAANAGTVRLALFGHTHSDEMLLLVPETDSTAPPTPAARPAAGVPVKLVASITPVNGNLPTFTLAWVDPGTADLKDYTVLQASNATGIDAAWTPAYTYSAAYHQPAFDAPALHTLIAGFQTDRSAHSPGTQAYIRNYFPGGGAATLLQLAWPEYACGLDHTSSAAYAACICATRPAPPAASLPPAAPELAVKPPNPAPSR
ncbi:MAG: metallophosphoesterase, partial [Acidobacteriota bacterium]|nr:metallophosphoesterase [Acidobacteriota bacterium]